MRFVSISGRAGSGKSRQLASLIGAATAAGRQAYLIVPDQFTLDAERRLMRQLGVPGLFDVEVLSFSRLYARVLEDCGRPKGQLLDARGRAMMASRVLQNQQQDLLAYGRYAHSPHFAARLSAQIAEFKRFDLSPSALTPLCEQQPRLQDIQQLYAGYEQAMAGHFTDNEDCINWVIERLPQAAFLRGASVFIDEFEMFTAQILRVVQALLKTAFEVGATFRLCEPGAADEGLFSLERTQQHRLIRAAQEVGAQVEELTLSPGDLPPRHHSAALLHLEHSLFALPQPVFEGPTEDVILTVAPDLRAEAHECARRILSLVREQGLRFEQLAVMVPDLSRYGPLLEQVFTSFDIPCFLDSKRAVGSHPFARYALLSLRLLLHGYAAQDVIALGKTGYSALSFEAVDELEEAVAVSGARYLSRSEGFLRYEQTHPRLVELRDELLHSHDALRVALQQARNASGQVEAFFAFLHRDGAVARANEQLMSLREAGDEEAALELEQVFATVCSVLTKLSTVMGEAKMPLQAFFDQLNVGLLSEEVGIIPSKADAVTVGSVGRSRLGDLEVLFLLGANEGQLPRGVEQDGLLTREDERQLQAHDLFMGNTHGERLVEEQHILYTLLSKPTRQLFVSYAQRGLMGEAQGPSPLIDQLKRCLSLPLHTLTPNDPARCIQTPAATLLPLAHALRESRRSGQPLSVPYARALEQLLPSLSPRLQESLLPGDPPDDNIGPELARLCYPDVATGGVTALETMAACPFAHFVHYALIANTKVRLYEKTAMDRGQYYHDIAQRYVQALLHDQLLDSLDRSRSDALLEALCQAYDEDRYLVGPYREDGRETYRAHAHRAQLREDCWQVAQHLKSGDFRPAQVEQAFTADLVMEDGTVAHLSGKIDRVDTATVAGEPVSRVVDYKTGTRDIDFKALLYGTALQLPLYARHAAERLNARSVGLFYQPLRNTVPPVGEAEKAAQARAQKTRLSGVYTQPCVQASEASTLVGGTNRTLAEEEYQALLHHGQRTAKSLMRARLDGVSAPSPLTGGLDSCEYCPYLAACGFDTAAQGGRVVPPVSKTAFLEAILPQEDRP